jgi:hypothetical protein
MKTKILALSVAALGCSLGTTRGDIVIDFASLSGGGVSFDGQSHFNFIPAPTTSQFEVTDAATPETGDQGYISSPSPDGFTIGTITDDGFGDEYAPVTGNGMFTIIDHNGQAFTGSVMWNDIFTSGTIGALNLDAVLNLNSISYNGTEADLLAIKNIGAATDTISFTILGMGQDLYSLASTPSTIGQFDGSIDAAVPVPEPTTLFAGALFALPFGASALRVLRRKQA